MNDIESITGPAVGGLTVVPYLVLRKLDFLTLRLRALYLYVQNLISVVSAFQVIAAFLLPDTLGRPPQRGDVLNGAIFRIQFHFLTDLRVRLGPLTCRWTVARLRTRWVPGNWA